MEFEITRTQIGTMTYLVLSAPFFTKEDLAILQDEVESCRLAHQVQLVFDFTKVPSLNSAALDTLLDCQESVARHGGRLQIVNANAVVRDILYVTGLSTCISVFGETVV